MLRRMHKTSLAGRKFIGSYSAHIGRDDEEEDDKEEFSLSCELSPIDLPWKLNLFAFLLEYEW